MTRLALALLFAAILIAMLTVTTYASLDRSIFNVGSELTSDLKPQFSDFKSWNLALSLEILFLDCLVDAPSTTIFKQKRPFETPEMPTTKDSVKAPEEQTKCMEVWGGSCASDDCFRRPGLDIWIQSQNVEFADAGGGDLHLLSSCASGRITRMLLADICGIGPLFSEIAGELRDLMK